MRLGLSLSEIERRTQKLANDTKNPGYQIFASSLYRVEEDLYDLNVSKFIALAFVIPLTMDQIRSLLPGGFEHIAE